MATLSIFSVLSNFSMVLRTALHGKFVGVDSLGNKYYRGKPIGDRKRDRRWVMYKGEPEASTVPPEWHGWLHHQTDVVPEGSNKYRKAWQMPPQANLTGTGAAYLPPGHTLRGGKRDAATGDYTAWQPPQ